MSLLSQDYVVIKIDTDEMDMVLKSQSNFVMAAREAFPGWSFWMRMAMS